MIQEEHAASLKARHAELEEVLEVETHKPNPDETAIKEIKKRKLQIKDELARLETA
jgi:hypothetical protein